MRFNTDAIEARLESWIPLNARSFSKILSSNRVFDTMFQTRFSLGFSQKFVDLIYSRFTNVFVYFTSNSYFHEAQQQFLTCSK